MKRFVATLTLILGIVLATAPSLSLATALHEVLPNSSAITSNELLVLTNQQRVSDGLAPLTPNIQLSEAATAKANDMVAEDYWSHYSPSGQTPWSFISAAGYNYHAAGENLAYGFSTAADTMTAWMNSPEHRANILDTNYSDVGFAIVASSNFVGTGPETIVVAEYGQPLAPTANPVPQYVPEQTSVITPVPPASPAVSTPLHTTTVIATVTQHKPKAHAVHHTTLSFLSRLISGLALRANISYKPRQLMLIHALA